MQVENLKRLVSLLSSADGSYRGLIQVPFNIGVCINLIKNGMSPTLALGSVVFWVIGMPRFFSFFTEVLGGVVAHNYGAIGSFKILPFGYFLRTLAMLAFMLGCILPNPTTILAVCCFGVLIGEIGRSFNSGAFEDAYKRTAERITGDSKDLVALCDLLGNINLLWLRAITAAVGTLCILCAHFSPKWEIVILCIPFVISILIHLLAMAFTLNWLSWAKRNVHESIKKQNLGSIWGQVKVFFLKKDYLWCLGIGGCLSFVLIYSINLAPLTVDSLLSDYSLGKLGWNDIMIATLLSFTIPFANLLGVKAFFNFIFKGFSKQDLFCRLDSWTGLLAIFTWLALALSFISYGPWGNETILIVSALAFLLAPLMVWTGWMRIPLLEEAEKNPEFKKEFGESHVFYYSLLEGCKETFFASFALFFSWSEEILSLSSFSLIIGVVGIGSLVYWKLFRISMTRGDNEGFSITPLKTP